MENISHVHSEPFRSESLHSDPFESSGVIGKPSHMGGHEHHMGGHHMGGHEHHMGGHEHHMGYPPIVTHRHTLGGLVEGNGNFLTYILVGLAILLSLIALILGALAMSGNIKHKNDSVHGKALKKEDVDLADVSVDSLKLSKEFYLNDDKHIIDEEGNNTIKGGLDLSGDLMLRGNTTFEKEIRLGNGDESKFIISESGNLQCSKVNTDNFNITKIVSPPDDNEGSPGDMRLMLVEGNVTFTGYIVNGILNVTNVSGSIEVGMSLTGTGVIPNTIITSKTDANTYNLNQTFNSGSQASVVNMLGSPTKRIYVYSDKWNYIPLTITPELPNFIRNSVQILRNGISSVYVGDQPSGTLLHDIFLVSRTDIKTKTTESSLKLKVGTGSNSEDTMAEFNIIIAEEISNADGSTTDESRQINSNRLLPLIKNGDYPFELSNFSLQNSEAPFVTVANNKNEGLAIDSNMQYFDGTSTQIEGNKEIGSLFYMRDLVTQGSRKIYFNFTSTNLDVGGIIDIRINFKYIR